MGLLLLGASAVGTMNVVVDPFDLGFVAGADALRARREHASRTAKAAIPLRLGCGTVLLGTSRTEAGFSAGGVLDGTNPINLALSTTNVVEIEHVLRYVLQRCEPSRVLLESSLLMFGSSRTTSQDFAQSLFNPELDATEFWMSSSFGGRALRQGIEVLRKHASGEAAHVGPRGFLAKRVTVSAREAAANVLRGFFTNPETYLGFELSEDRLVSFEHMLRAVAAREIPVAVFIPPVHALQLEAIRVAGLSQDYERWKRAMARTADRTGVPVYDFQDGSAISGEPLSGSVDAPMQWYFESSHFRPALGEKVLARMLEGHRDPELPGPLLRTDSFERHLATQRARRKRFAERHPGEIAWLESIHAEAVASTSRSSR